MRPGLLNISVTALGIRLPRTGDCQRLRLQEEKSLKEGSLLLEVAQPVA